MCPSISIFAISMLGATAPGRWMDVTEMEREASIRQLASEPLPGRLLQASEKFLGTPYAPSPLGEGQGKDADPLIRFDAVDCLTFVEETLAISFAVEPREIEPILIDLRYAKEVAFDERNHLMEAQWLPHNLAKGFLRDVTRQYGGDSTEMVHKTLTRTTWASRSSRALGLSHNREPLGTFDLPIIPLRRVRAVANRIPSGTILAVVREDRPYKPTRISHVGFVLHRGQKTYLRHPRLSLSGRLPFGRIRYDAGSTEYGPGDAEVGAKVRLIATPHGGLLLSAGASFELPTGSEVKGLGAGHFEISPFVTASSAPANNLVLYGLLADRISTGRCSSSWLRSRRRFPSFRPRASTCWPLRAMQSKTLVELCPSWVSLSPSHTD